MSQPLVFLTDVSGPIGFAALAALLKRGHPVRVTSCDRETNRQIKDQPAIRPHAKSLSFIKINDFLVAEAFETALKGVFHVIHVASPTRDDPVSVTMFGTQKVSADSASQATLAMLRAARRSSSVHRVIITSSIELLQHPTPSSKPHEVVPNVWAAYRILKTIDCAAKGSKPAQQSYLHVAHIVPSCASTCIDESASYSKPQIGGKERPPIASEAPISRNQTRPPQWVRCDTVVAALVAGLETGDATSREGFDASYPPAVQWSEVEQVMKQVFP
ncbi:hypothetical protein EDD37DRAFT_610258 [Exophiala viscosa]|uniref:NAD-dependent epimerase/dehydratase domain-containing protein n=1 Tax=Exophiala viscosa TaxID=2486360 RepID=A0AAN6ICP1_9EURO|nr:hypothetical protein EDD36DRAFT_466044 [Exophiala viscosa]KAI1622940.1 hypothetical protein EDD37DRAFT_610258 [Exophiala viscosa]